jgi:hypothetical protein
MCACPRDVATYWAHKFEPNTALDGPATRSPSTGVVSSTGGPPALATSAMGLDPPALLAAAALVVDRLAGSCDEAKVHAGRCDEAKVHAGRCDEAKVHAGRCDEAEVHAGRCDEAEVHALATAGAASAASPYCSATAWMAGSWKLGKSPMVHFRWFS